MDLEIQVMFRVLEYVWQCNNFAKVFSNEKYQNVIILFIHYVNS